MDPDLCQYIHHRMPEISPAQAQDVLIHAGDYLRMKERAEQSNREIDELEAVFPDDLEARA